MMVACMPTTVVGSGRKRYDFCGRWGFDEPQRDAAVLSVIGIGPDQRRRVLGVSCALSEAEVHWRAFLETLEEGKAIWREKFVA